MEPFVKVTLYRNGYEDNRSTSYTFRKRRYLDMELLIDQINKLGISKLEERCDKAAMTRFGTKYLYDVNGREITSVDQMVEGGKYVCCATKNFSPVSYGQSEIKITVVCMILAGPRPRKMIKVAMASKMLPTLKGLKDLLVQWFNIPNSNIEAIYDLEGNLIVTMSQLLKCDLVIVYEHLLHLEADFVLSVRERENVRKMISSHLSNPMRYREAFAEGTLHHIGGDSPRADDSNRSKQNSFVSSGSKSHTLLFPTINI